MVLLNAGPWTMTDDSGDGQSGTVMNAPWLSNIKNSIDALIHDTNNPLESPAGIITEVVTARGSTGSLDARISAVVDSAGVPVVSATTASTTQLSATLASKNLVMNGEPLIWNIGDGGVPYGWALTGAGATMARTTAGTHFGGMAAVMTRASAATFVQQDILDTANFNNVANLLKGTYLAIGCFVKTTVANSVQIYATDGSSQVSSAFHTGDGTYQYLTALLPISTTATQLSVGIQSLVNGTVATWCGFSAVKTIAGVSLNRWIPSEYETITRSITIPGNAAVVVDKCRFAFPRGTIIKSCWLSVVTAPTGAALIVDLESWDGAAWNTLFSGATDRPSIAASAFVGWGVCAGSYRARCLGEASAASSGTSSGPDFFNSTLRVAVDQVGSGVTGADLTIVITGLMCKHPLEAFINAQWP